MFSPPFQPLGCLKSTLTFLSPSLPQFYGIRGHVNFLRGVPEGYINFLKEDGA